MGGGLCDDAPVTASIFLVKGSDDVLRGDAVKALVDRMLAGADRGLLVDEFAGNDYDLGAAIDAAQTPPFLTERRIIVIRHLGRFPRADDVAALVTYLHDPLPTTELVLVWERAPESSARSGGPTGRTPAVPASLTKAVTAAGGETVSTDAPTGKGLAAWIAEQLAEAGVVVDASGRGRIAESLGDDAGAMVGLVQRLVGAHGPGVALSVADIEPFLGEAGGVPPWELTDAIDQGDVAGALDRLRRMTAGGKRHPLAVMASLQSHFVRILRLDGADARGEKQAAAKLGLKGSTFPAKKALTQLDRLGHDGATRAVDLLAQTDLGLRGATAWPEGLLMEVLVARLARLARTPARR